MTFHKLQKQMANQAAKKQKAKNEADLAWFRQWIAIIFVSNTFQTRSVLTSIQGCLFAS